MMERQQIHATMGELKLFGMKAAYDEIIKVALKRSHEPQQIVGDLLQAEISEKHARSIRYQMTIAKLPLAKDLAEFAFAGRRLTRVWCATSAAASSWPTSATSCWWAAPARARRTWPSRLPGLASPDGARPGLQRGRPRQPLEAEARAGRQGAHRPTTSPGSTCGAGRTRLPAVRAVGLSAAVST